MAPNPAARAMGHSARGLDDLSDEIQLDGVHRMADDFKGAADPTRRLYHRAGKRRPAGFARLLCQAQKGLEEAATRWPEWHRTLTESARLCAAQEQMQSTLATAPSTKKR